MHFGRDNFGKRGLLYFLLILLTFTAGHAQSTFQTGFHSPGVDGDIYVINQFKTSRLFIGGNFSVVSGTGRTIQDFAVYDFQDGNWEDTGFDTVMTGTFRWVEAIELANNRVIVSGRFTNADNSIKNIAQWTGSEWLPLTPNDALTDGEIHTIVADQFSGFYVGGEFTQIGGVAAKRVAKWDEANGWQALGGGLGFEEDPVDETVNVLKYHDGKLYAAGSFRDPNNDDALRFESVAVWDGTSWEYLGEGIYYAEQVYDMMVETDTVTGGDRVYIAGDFRWVNGLLGELDTVTTRGVAAYLTSDSSWQAFNNPELPSWTEVRSIERVNGDLVIGGDWLDDTGTRLSSRLAILDEDLGAWSSWGYGVPFGKVWDIHPGYAKRVYVGGEFERIGTVDGLWTGEPRYVSGLAFRDTTYADSIWYPIGDGTASYGSLTRGGVNAFAVQIDEVTSDTSIILAGTFEVIGGMITNGLAAKSDTGWYTWPDFPSGGAPNIASVDVNGDSILVAGLDLYAGTGDPRDNLAVWDGTSWNDVGGGTGNGIMDRAIFDTNGDILVGGSFYNGTNWTILKRWDGANWIDLQTNPNSGGEVTAMERHPTADTVFVAGVFNSGVAIVQDSSVAPLGGTANAWLTGRWNGAVTSLLPTPYGIYMGMDRYNTDLLRFHRFGEPNGWFSFGDTTYYDCYGDVLALENTLGCELLLGGIKSVGFNCDSFPGLLSYESGFSAAGSLTGQGVVYDMLKVGDQIWIGGFFDDIAGIPSTDLAVLSIADDSTAVSRLQFTSAPAKDTVLNYGEAFHIDWQFSDSIPRLVTLEVTLDSGLTWTEVEITSTTPLEFGRWWLVPDTNASFCQFRVADVALPCVAATSEMFSVQADPGLRVEWLTRGSPNAAHPQPYVPAHNDWSFDNRRYFMWPEVQWRDFDYSGFIINADNDLFPSWERYCDAFGNDWCYTDEVLGVDVEKFADPVAYTDWRLISGDWNGSCFGFALTSIRAFLNFYLGLIPPPESAHLDTLWRARTDYNTETDSLRQIRQITRNNINRYFCYQLTLDHAFIVAGRSGAININTPVGDFGDEPMKTLQTIRHDWNDFGGSLNARVLALWDWNNLSRAHAVLPYKIVNHDDSADIYQLFIYDSNENGGDTLHIRIDSSANTWEYAFETLQRDDSGIVTDTLDRGWNPAGDGLFVLKKVTEYGATALENSRLPISQPVAAQQQNDTTALFAMARVDPTYDILFVSDSGDTTGYWNGSVLWQSQNTAPIYPMNSLYESRYPLSYLMPDSARSIVISNTLDTSVAFGWTTDSSAFAYERFDAVSGQTDGLRIDNQLTAFNPDGVAKTIQLDAAIHDTTSGRLIRVSQIDMAQNDSLSLAIDSAGVVTIDNAGSAKSVQLLLWGTDPVNGDQYVEASDIVIEDTARYTIGLDWVDLGGAQTMELDRGRDGTVDETVPLNVTVGIDDVGDGTLPEQFELEQNYPNPFNPSTTIAFTLPERADVRLEVFNILGRVVNTLVDKTLSAGQYEVTWDGRTDSGQPLATGVYFYRLTTGDRSATKKMLLLK